MGKSHLGEQALCHAILGMNTEPSGWLQLPHPGKIPDHSPFYPESQIQEKGETALLSSSDSNPADLRAELTDSVMCK